MKSLHGILLSFIVLMACNQNEKPSRQPALAVAPSPAVEQGKDAVQKVKVSGDTTLSYSLYVPANADSGSMVLLFFDPGAKGNKPVDKYKSLAQRHGIILAGSNNSRNGLSGDASAVIAQNVVYDLQQRFNVKRQNIYACGFSGGARVAVLAAIGENLPGVIGCGGGFPGKADKNYGFYHIGVVGNTDFNYLEMKRLYHELEQVRMQHQLLVFEGAHEWPPQSEMEKAILLLRQDAHANQLLETKIDSAVAVLKEQKAWVRLYDELRLGITAGLDSAHTNGWKKELKSLRNNKACIAELKSEAEIETNEAEMQGKIAKAFSGKDFTFLANEVKRCSLQSEKSALLRLSNRRMLQFISLMSYLYSEKALASDAGMAKQYLSIYEQADAGNPDYHFLKACYYVKVADKISAMEELRKAILAGFDDAEKLKNNTALQTLKQEPGFAELIHQLPAD